MKFKPTDEQRAVLQNQTRSLVVSASAGSGKTAVLVEDIVSLVVKKSIPLKRILVLTFTNVAANEMKGRILQSLSQITPNRFLYDQIDDLPNADICTIDSFCEKVIKKNIEKLSLDQTFSVIDEEEALLLKREAFQDACMTFVCSNKDEYWHIFNCFKRNKQAVFECMLKMQSFLDSNDDGEGFLQYILKNQERFFDDACTILLENFKSQFDQARQQLLQLESLCSEPKLQEFSSRLRQILDSLDKEDFFKVCQAAALVNLPVTPRVDSSLKETFSQVRGQIKKIIEQLCQFSTDPDSVAMQKSGFLATSLTKLFQVFENNYIQLKAQKDVLDFADIEKYCALLLQQPSVAQNLQNSFDYVFVDEYQDTNFLQANIIKTISKICKFVAVGDPKQAIYGFRNATMEIMKGDIHQNSQDKDGNVVYLNGNFRSDKRLLDFVNHIFRPLMTTQSTGIDYGSTSMLKGLAPYQDDSKCAVDVLLLKPFKNEKQDISDVYSIKRDHLVQDEKDWLEAKAICAYVDSLLMQKIYDVKEKVWRPVQLCDIAILLRSRGSLLGWIEKELKSKGFPVISDSKENIATDEQVQVLLNVLKVSISAYDEKDYVSVLLSKIGQMTMDEIAQISIEQEGNNLTEKLEKSGNEKVKKLNENIEIFRRESEIFGLHRAYELLFDRCDYVAYLKNLDQAKYEIVEKFLSKIGKADFSPATALEMMLSGSNVNSVNEQADANAINIMTIHSSKGMEFPIVILAGCGKSLTNPDRTQYLLTNRLGLATLEYDTTDMIKIRTPQFEASKLLKKHSEYIDELMIFYVALTRAKNRLILTGDFDLQTQKCKDMFDAKCYLDWIMFAQNDKLIAEIEKNQFAQTDFANFVYVTDVENLKSVQVESIYSNPDKALTKKIEDYFNFSYPNIDLAKQEYKNSVTGLLKLNFDDKEEGFDKKVQVEKSQFSASDVGTIYHLALKEIDFSGINTAADIKNEIDRLCQQGYLDSDQAKSIDQGLLFKDIMILKNLTKGKQVFKERAFIMKLPLSQIFDTDKKDQVLVQGVVDMFALGEQNILVDYKYTSTSNAQTLIKRYKPQLELYSKAIEGAFGIKLHKKIIFSIKNGQIIEF